MTDNEFLLFDRITKIKSVIEEYGEENFYVAFSGGKDSTVLSHLLDIIIRLFAMVYCAAVIYFSNLIKIRLENL